MPGAAVAPSSNAADAASSVAMTKAPADKASTTLDLRLPAFETAMTTVAPRNDATAIHSKRVSWPVWTARTSAKAKGAALLFAAGWAKLGDEIGSGTGNRTPI